MFEIGSSLRAARLRRGLELADAEAATMIRARYLAALEDERFDVLPEGPYARSFVREYAEFLGLDGDLYVTELYARTGPDEAEPLVPQPVRTIPALAELPLAKPALVLAAAAVVAFAVWGLGGSSPSRVPALRLPLSPARPSAAAAPITRRPVTAPAPAPAQRWLVLRAVRGRCWLLVRGGSRDGPLVFEGTLEQGRAVRLGVGRPLWIRLGAPWNVDAVLGGKAVGLPARTGNVLVTAESGT